MQVELAK